MYAVIETGGKQHRVEVGSVVNVELLGADKGQPVVFDKVLLVSDGGAAKVGNPTLTGAQVKGTVVDIDRGPKIVIYKFKHRQNANRRRSGHRQWYAAVKIDSIKA